MSQPTGPTPPRLPESAAKPVPNPIEQLAELSAIAGGLAHEIRNSLSTLRVNLQLLDEDWGAVAPTADEAGGDVAETVRRSRTRIGTLLREATRLECILEDFLVFVRKRELNRASRDLNDLVGELADFYQPQADAHGIRLRTDPAREPLVCAIDSNLIKQAVLNLMLNAQQAMGRGGVLTIRLSAESRETARIDVIDTGPGIAPEDVSRVFDAYYSTKKRGTGLGLTTARQIIREHGGRIHLTSEPGEGCCFTILLPRE